MHAPLQQNRQCLRGLQCYQMTTTGKDNITMVFKDIKLGANKMLVMSENNKEMDIGQATYKPPYYCSQNVIY